MDTMRIKIKTIDRPRMTYDILSVLVKYERNIIWMEVYTHVVYIKMPRIDTGLWQTIKSEILDIPGVKGIEEIDLIAFEEREIEMKTILDILPQGFILLDREGRIKYVNKFVARNIFLSDESKIINKNIWDFIPREKLSGYVDERFVFSTEIENIEIKLNNRTFFLSVHGITSEQKMLLGYIVTLQDTKEINDILNLKRYENSITFSDIIARSKKMKDVIDQAKIFAQSDAPVLILGESGTGKELFARAIHNMSSRSSKPFVAINCAAIPDQLLESELFGYEEGAFTGAKKRGKTGIFEIANGGTIFLDEIGEMSPHLQAKLLRVLQENKIQKLGSNTVIDIDVRVITATNRNLFKMVENGQFRLDLLYRINTFTLKIPPLRERKEDIDPLVEHFLNIYTKKYNKKIERLSYGALKKIFSYDWPGNVRELQNVVERAVAFAKNSEIKEEDVVLNVMAISEPLGEICSLKEALELTEKNIILNVLKNSKSIREAARNLKITHTMLINRIKKYKIKDSDWRLNSK